MKIVYKLSLIIILIITVNRVILCQTSPDKINFVRQGVQRMIFDENLAIPLASLEPNSIIGLSSMHPIKNYSNEHPAFEIRDGNLIIQSKKETQSDIWFAGFNPFATYSIDLASCTGEGEIGFKFSSSNERDQFFIKIGYKDSIISGVGLKVIRSSETIADKSIAINLDKDVNIKGKIILKMLGSGLTLYLQDVGLPKVVGQSEFNIVKESNGLSAERENRVGAILFSSMV